MTTLTPLQRPAFVAPADLTPSEVTTLRVDADWSLRYQLAYFKEHRPDIVEPTHPTVVKNRFFAQTPAAEGCKPKLSPFLLSSSWVR